MAEAHLWPVEHAGLVHVIPDVQIWRGPLVLGQRKLLCPPRPHFWIQHVQVGRRARPAPSEVQHKCRWKRCADSMVLAKEAHVEHCVQQTGGKRSTVAPVKVLAVLVSHKVMILLRFLVNVVSRIPLDVGINDGHHLAPMGCNILLQLHWVREQILVPCEIPA